jgi:hypothetical protein
VKIALPVPPTWRPLFDASQPRPPGVEEAWQVGGATVVVEPLKKLPNNLRAWGDRVVFGDLARERVLTRDVGDKLTESGWPVTMFITDVVDPATKAVTERRLHALYRFLQWAGVVVARTSTVAEMDAAGRVIAPVLLGATLDWRGDEVLSLAEVWDGLEVAPGSEPAPKPVPEPGKIG